MIPFREICLRMARAFPFTPQSVYALGVLIATLSVIACFDELPPVTNPIAPGYEGDYHFSLTFEGQPVEAGGVLKQKLYAFTPYPLSHKTTGLDPFVAFRVVSVSEDAVDTTWQGLEDINWDSPPARTADSSVTVYFSKPYEGIVSVQGMRPNGQGVETRFSVVVENPLSVSGPALLAVGARGAFLLRYAGPNLGPLSETKWYVDGVFRAAGQAFDFSSQEAGTYNVHALATDLGGNQIETPVVTVVVSKDATLPARVSVITRNRALPRGDSLTLQVQCMGCDSLRWVFASGESRGTLGRTLGHVFASDDTVQVTGFNSEGQPGNTDTLFITVADYKLILEEVRFPETIAARAWQTFRTRILRETDSGTQTVPDARLTWSTVPAAVGDSMRNQADSARFFFQDSAQPFLLRVQAVYEGDSSFVLEKRITVRAYRPWVNVDKSTEILDAGDTLRLKIASADTDKGGRVARIVYVTSEEEPWREADLEFTGVDTVYATLKRPFLRVGEGWVRIHAVDGSGFHSDTFEVSVTIKPGAPRISALAADTSLIHVDTPFKMRVDAVDVGGKVEELEVRVMGSAGRDTTIDLENGEENVSQEISLTFSSAGKFRIGVRAKDDAGQYSPMRYLPDSLIVSDGRPLALGVSPESIWMKDDTVFTIRAKDVNGFVKTYSHAFGDAPFAISDDSTFSRSFDAPGLYFVKIRVTDNEDGVSDPIEKAILVRQGRPSIAGSLPGEAWAFDPAPLNLVASDTNGRITGFHVNWDIGVGDEFVTFSAPGGQVPGRDVRLSPRHTYATGGVKTVRYFALDEDGNSSDTATTSILVRLGTPTVLSVEVTSDAGKLYVQDTLRFVVRAQDPNGSITRVFASWDGDASFEAETAALGDSAVLTHVFAAGDSGVRSVRIRVQDDDGLTGDKNISVTLLSGAPKISGMHPLQTWIHDDSSYTIEASDENGSVQMYFWDFDSDGLWDDSSGSGSVDHGFDSDGQRTVRLGARDEDGVMGYGEARVQVRLGRPMVSMPPVNPPTTAIIGDTVFYQVDANGGTLVIAPHFADSNGSLERFYFDQTIPLDTNNTLQKGSQDSYEYTITSEGLDMPFQMAAFALDDDGLLSGRTFWVFPDGPPDRPGVFHYSQTDDSVFLEWEKSFDAHDNLETEYQIRFKYGSSGEPNDVLMDWTKGKDMASFNATKFKFGFAKELTDVDAMWRVYIRDARGSVVFAPIMGAPATLYISP